jgi:hypothetical protein
MEKSNTINTINMLCMFLLNQDDDGCSKINICSSLRNSLLKFYS